MTSYLGLVEEESLEIGQPQVIVSEGILYRMGATFSVTLTSGVLATMAATAMAES